MADYSDIDLCYLWLDYGDTWLKTACTEMLRSAQRAMPGINVVQISDNKSRIHPMANASLIIDHDVPKSELAAFKGTAFARHALQTERPTIFCDVDLIWNNEDAADFVRHAPEPRIMMHRRANVDWAILPFDPAMILYKPSLSGFWDKYQRLCDSCKPGFREWWGDQLAFGMLELDVHVLPNLTAEPELRPIEKLHEPAAHFDAHRDWLVPYARLLDGGAPFEELMPGLDEVVYERSS